MASRTIVASTLTLILAAGQVASAAPSPDRSFPTQGFGVETLAGSVFDDFAFINYGAWTVPLNLEWLEGGHWSYLLDLEFARTDLTARRLADLEGGSHADRAFLTHGYSASLSPGVRYYLTPEADSFFADLRVGASTNRDRWDYHGVEANSDSVHLYTALTAGYRFVTTDGFEIRPGAGLGSGHNISERVSSSQITAANQVKSQIKNATSWFWNLACGKVF